MRRYKKDYSIDGWPVLDTDLKTVLGTDDIVNILNDYESETTKLRAELEQLKSELPSIKADAIRDAMENCKSVIRVDDDLLEVCYPYNLKAFSDKIERGEV